MFWAALREDLARWYAAVAEKVRHFQARMRSKFCRVRRRHPLSGSLLLGETDAAWYVAQRSLLLCFGVSLLLHLTAFGTYRVGKHWGWWDYQASWLSRWTQPAKPSALLENLQKLLDKKPKEIPLTFVDVDPATATEPPKAPQYYSVVDTMAANRGRRRSRANPRSTANKTRCRSWRTIPSPRRNRCSPPHRPNGKPSRAHTEKGAISVVDGTARSRPRTYAEAVQRNPRLPASRCARPRRKPAREGVPGCESHSVRRLRRRVHCRGAAGRYHLIDNSRLAPRTGKVVIEFRLNYDGRITDLKVTKTEVGEMLSLLCQEAIRKPAPFPRWPSDMWRAMGKNHREVMFTFYYN